MKLLILAIFLINISGCWWNTRIDVDVEATPRAPLVLPVPDLFKYEPIPWYIVTEENAQEVFKDLEEKGYDPVIFGLTDKGYENISINQAKIFKLMTQFRAIIDASEEYYKEEGTEDGSNGTEGTNNNKGSNE